MYSLDIIITLHFYDPNIISSQNKKFDMELTGSIMTSHHKDNFLLKATCLRNPFFFKTHNAYVALSLLSYCCLCTSV